jgi:hypothetical protein
MFVIETKFIGPTNHRGSRIAARASYGRVVINYDHSQSTYNNHLNAAAALARKCNAWVATAGMFPVNPRHGYTFGAKHNSNEIV